MLPNSVIDRFVEHCPPTVMIRATLEHLFRDARVDQIFEEARQRQYCKQLYFSEVVAVMLSVATRVNKSVHVAYHDSKETLGVSSVALYAKLNHIEPNTATMLVREIAADAAKVIDAMPPSARNEILPGIDVLFLDGNHLASTEHRLTDLRFTNEGPLPGQSLALLDAQTGLIVDLVLCEDGHAQERALLPELQERIKAGTLIVADRNFCTGIFLAWLMLNGVYFVIRQHGSTLKEKKLCDKPKKKGRTKTGSVWEQPLEFTEKGKTFRVRRLTIRLDKPTEAGDKEIHILTNLPAELASAEKVVEIYKDRWTVERAFQTLTDVMHCELETLGYPKAALFSFAVAVLALNAYAVVKAAMRGVHGREKIEEKLSDYQLLTHVAMTYVGMNIAVPEKCWKRFQTMSAKAFANAIMELASRVKLERYPKYKRGPKKPKPKRKSGARNHHIATSRLLAQKKEKRP